MKSKLVADGNITSPLTPNTEGGNEHMENGYSKPIPAEVANETILGEPSVKINKLRKTFSGGQVAVNDLSFNMYKDQIFVLVS